MGLSGDEQTNPGTVSDLADRARAAMDAGDFRMARRLAKQVLAQCRGEGSGDSEAVRTAEWILDATGPDRLALVLGVLVFLAAVGLWVGTC